MPGDIPGYRLFVPHPSPTAFLHNQFNNSMLVDLIFDGTGVLFAVGFGREGTFFKHLEDTSRNI